MLCLVVFAPQPSERNHRPHHRRRRAQHGGAKNGGQVGLSLACLARKVCRRWNLGRADEMETQRGARPSPVLARSNRSTANLLQQTLRPETSDGIDDRHHLPLEQPAGHRKTNRRVAQMHHSHNHPRQARSSRCRSQGEAPQKLYRHNSNRHSRGQGTSVPSRWHGSNTLMALPNNSCLPINSRSCPKTICCILVAK